MHPLGTNGNHGSRLIRALAVLASLNMAYCGSASDIDRPGEDLGADPDADTPGIAELSQPLEPLATACVFTSATGVAAIVVAKDEVAVISKQASDGALLVNAEPCEAATTKATKRILVSEDPDATGSQTVVLDFANGLFGQGSAKAVGIEINLGVGHDAAKFRGSKSNDSYVLGADGVNFRMDAYKDATVTNVEEYTFSLGAGNDNFTAMGATVPARRQRRRSRSTARTETIH